MYVFAFAIGAISIWFLCFQVIQERGYDMPWETRTPEGARRMMLIISGIGGLTAVVLLFGWQLLEPVPPARKQPEETEDD